MTGTSALVLPLVLLLLLGALTGWIDHTVRAPLTGTPAAALEPESIVENFSALKTGPDGRAHYRLDARILRHYGENRASMLERPRFVQLAADGGQTRAAARTASLSADGSTVTLNGAVDLQRQLGDAPGFALRTERLVLRLDQERLHAPGPVVLTDARYQAQAGRMDYDNRTRIVKLSGRVRAVYRNAPS